MRATGSRRRAAPRAGTVPGGAVIAACITHMQALRTIPRGGIRQEWQHDGRRHRRCNGDGQQHHRPPAHVIEAGRRQQNAPALVACNSLPLVPAIVDRVPSEIQGGEQRIVTAANVDRSRQNWFAQSALLTFGAIRSGDTAAVGSIRVQTAVQLGRAEAGRWCKTWRKRLAVGRGLKP